MEGSGDESVSSHPLALEKRLALVDLVPAACVCGPAGSEKSVKGSAGSRKGR